MRERPILFSGPMVRATGYAIATRRRSTSVVEFRRVVP